MNIVQKQQYAIQLQSFIILQKILQIALDRNTRQNVFKIYF